MSIKPGVQRAERANPRIAIQKGFSPRTRATEVECGGTSSSPLLWIDPIIEKAVARFAGFGTLSGSRSWGSRPRLYAFVRSAHCPLNNRKIAGLTPNHVPQITSQSRAFAGSAPPIDIAPAAAMPLPKNCLRVTGCFLMVNLLRTPVYFAERFEDWFDHD